MSVRLPRFLRRLFAPLTRDARDRDIAQEMDFHIESLTQEHVRAGMNEADAARAARKRFGRPLRLKEEGHDIRSARLVEDLARDVRHAARGLRRSPGFAVAVILALAIGIGSNTAIFSIVDQLLLRPLPYPNGDELVMVHEMGRQDDGSLSRFSVSPANWLDWQQESRTLRRFAAWVGTAGTLTGVGPPTRVDAQRVSSEFFPLLGVAPLLGRTISDEDDRPDAPLVAVLSHRMWQRQFGGDAAIVGRVFQLNDEPFEVVGVMPADFRFMNHDVDVWSAARLDRTRPWRDTDGRFISVVARLEHGTGITTARAEMKSIAQQLAATYAFNTNTTVELVPLREALTSQVATSLWVLYAAVGVLLSIACFNVANLLLARAASRTREIGIRTTLGAGRLAVIRQLLVESLLLATAGGALGILLARWSLDALLAFAPPALLRTPELVIDRRILLYAIGVSLLTGLVVGLAPAILFGGRPVVASLGARGSGVAHSPRVRQALVACQVALTVVLLCGAGVLVRTLVALDRTTSGVDKHDLLTMRVALPPARYDVDRRVAFYRDAVAALRALPGVQSAVAAHSLPVVEGPRAGTAFHRLGTPELPLMERPSATIRVVTSGYFHTLGIPVLRGREFVDADDANPLAGFIVNQAFVDTHLRDVDPLEIAMSVWMEDENPHLPVIGVVGNVSEGSIRNDPKPTIFYSHRRLAAPDMSLFVRTTQAEALAQPAVDAIHELDPNLAVTRVRTFEEALADSLARERLIALVSGSFAVSGLLLASLGLYGLLAYLVTQRTREIGVRIAIGAQPGQVTSAVVGGGLRLAAIGAVAGVVAALLLLRSFGELLFGVTPYDLWTYAGVLALLAVVAALASYVPARRAARIEPLVALRQE